MKRTTRDVPRWHAYLHRSALGLPYADPADSPDLRLADEVFERLYAGDPPVAVAPQIAPGTPAAPEAPEVVSARAAHALVERAAGDFGKVAAACRGDAAASATAARGLLEAALPRAPEAPPSGAQRDAADGLSGVGGLGAPWSGKWRGEAAADERARTLADRLARDERLKKIALLAGKFKRVALSKQKVKVHRGADEVTDVEQGDDLIRLLPSELARLAGPRLRRLAAIRDLMERRCLQYRMTSTENLGRGPLILCLDKSGSMEGDKDVWSSAVALALLECVHRERRPFVLLDFNTEVFYRVVVRPGRPLPEVALFQPCDGGTDVGKVLDLALHAVETKRASKRADIIIVTDGQSSTTTAARVRARAGAACVRIFGVGIGVPESALAPWCDPGMVAHVEDVGQMGESAAGLLFGV